MTAEGDRDGHDAEQWTTRDNAHMGREQQGPSTTQAAGQGNDQARPQERGKETSARVGTRANGGKRKQGDNNQKTPTAGRKRPTRTTHDEEDDTNAGDGDNSNRTTEHQ